MPFSDAIRIGASGAADPYEIDRSLRFSGVGETRLNYTPASGGEKKRFTFSFWIKRGNLDRRMIFGAYNSGASTAVIEIQDDGLLHFYDYVSGYRTSLRPAQVFRDPSAWYHIVFAYNSTLSTSSDRAKIYINGTRVTEFDNATYPSQNQEALINDHTIAHAIGTEGSLQRLHFDGYMAEFYFLDGIEYDASYFGETDATTGQWIPKEYTGSFGNNGYYLKFADNSSTSALGTDSSGNGNNLTPVNFSVTAGKTDDSFFDTPTNNMPTLSPVDRTYTTGVILSEANTRWQYNYKPASKTVRATMALPSTGKIYMEWENEQGSGQAGRMSWGLVRYASQGQTYDYQAYNHVDYINISFGGSTWNGTTHLNPPGSGWPSFTFYTGERAALAIDCSNGKWWLGKVASNGSTTWYANDGGTDGDPAGGTNESATLPNFTTATEWMPFVGWHDGGAASSTTYYANINFGNHSFLGTIPTGFEKLSSKVLDEPTIKLPNKHFDLLLYTGTDSAASRTLTGLNFSPDWVWQKRRNGTNWNGLHDTVRGGGRTLYSNDTSVDTTNNQYGYISAFTSDGFTWSPGSTNNSDGNHTSGTYVSWCWNAGGTDSATYTVKVVSDSGNKYRFNDFGTSAVTLDLAEGGTYTFDQSDSSMSPHPMLLSTTANGHHGGGSTYNTGVTYQLDGSSVNESAFVSGFSSASSRKLIITVAASAPNLNYFCHYHSGMGGAINTNSTLGSSNFDGSIQSTVKANTTAGFSIVSYEGNNVQGATVGHGLGVAPSVVIVKNRESTYNWAVWHTGLLSAAYVVNLNLSSAQGSVPGIFNSTLPTSTVFTLGGGSQGDRFLSNEPNKDFIAYIFSEVAGYSSFGKYTGNGNSTGPFVYTGFRPAWVLLKGGSFAGNWNLFDEKRPGFNVTNDILYPNLNNAEYDGSPTDNQIDILSNGFKLRGSNVDTNSNTSTFIYLAFAESPFKNSRAR